MNLNIIYDISDFDIFAKRLGLFHNRKEKIGSYYGLSLTLIYIVASLIIFIYYTISIVKREELQVNDSTEYSEETPYINLNNSNLFYFAFGVENTVNASRFVDETIYRARAVYYYGEKDSSGAFKTIEYRDLKIEKCKVEKFGKEYQHLFTKGEFDNSYCVDNFDLALTGGFMYDKFSCIRILLYPCINKTENNYHCKPQEEIDKVLAGGYFSVLLKDIGLNPTNYTFPILPTIQDFYTTISKDFFRDVIFYYEITDILSDYGLFIEQKRKERYLRYDKIKESFYFRDDKEYYYKGKNICKVEIRLSDNIHVQRRSYKKMSNVFSTTGGYMQVLYSIFMLLSLIPNHFIFEKIIVNSLLNIDFKTNINSQKYHNSNTQKNSLLLDHSQKAQSIQSNNALKKKFNLNMNGLQNINFKDIEKNKSNRIKEFNEVFSISKINHRPPANKNENDYSYENVKNISFIENSNNVSKIHMFPHNIKCNNINSDSASNSNKNSNKLIFNYPKENSFFNKAKEKGLKEIKFNIFEYYCIGKCFNKTKKIELFNKGCSLFREEMDVIHIFTHLLDMEKSIKEKSNLSENVKIFYKNTFI